MEGAKCYCSLCTQQGAHRTPAQQIMFLFPWKLGRTLLILGCKHCKNFGEGLSPHSWVLQAVCHSTLHFSLQRCLVSEKLLTLMAGYMRSLKDFPSSSQPCEFHRINSPGPEQGWFMFTLTVLCPAHSSVLPTVCLQIKGTNAHSTEWLTLVPLIPTFSIILHLGVIPKHRS